MNQLIPKNARREPSPVDLMTPLRASLVDRDTTRRERLASLLRRIPCVEIVTDSGGSDLIGTASGRADLVLIALHGDGRRELADVAQAAAADPELRILVAGDADNSALVREAMQAGAREFLRAPIDANELEEAIARAAAARRGRVAVGRMASVLPACGGCGATMLAVNLAVALRSHCLETALVDLDFPGGSTALYLDMRPEYGLSDICHGASRVDRTMVRGAIARHATGLGLLAALGRGDDTRPLDEERLRDALSLLRGLFAWMVIDLPRTLSPSTGRTLRESDQILLVTRRSVAGLAGAARTLSLLRRGGIELGRVTAIVSDFGGQREISDSHAADLLGVEHVISIPEDVRLVSRSLDAGRPLVSTAPVRPVARAIQSLAGAILAGDTKDSKPRIGRVRRWLAAARASL